MVSDAGCSGGDFVGKRGSGIRLPVDEITFFADAALPARFGLPEHI